MAFMSNNIKYRSTTAKALEEYYSTKAFILNELSDSRNDFSKGAREILLMMLNNYKEWTDFTEQYLLDKKQVVPQDVEVVVSNLQRISSVNMTVFESHPEVFPPEFIQLWKLVGHNTTRYFFQRVRRAAGKDHLEAYPFLIDCLLSCLQSIMYTLFEIDCLLGCELLKTGRPVTTNRSNPNRLVLLIDDKDLDFLSEFHVFDPELRLEKYIQYVEPQSPILIKNLSSSEVVFNSGTRELSGDVVLAQHLLPLIAKYNVVEVMSNKR
jgi:hypothetical protein